MLLKQKWFETPLKEGFKTTFLILRLVLDDRGAYQLAFWTPGMRPLLAMLRKQMRQMPNFR